MHFQNLENIFSDIRVLDLSKPFLDGYFFLSVRLKTEVNNYQVFPAKRFLETLSLPFELDNLQFSLTDSGLFAKHVLKMESVKIL